MKKKNITLVFTVVISGFMLMSAFAGTWEQDSVGYWYQNNDGSYPVGKLQEINGQQYQFDFAGYLQAYAPTVLQKQIMEKQVSPLITGYEMYAGEDLELKSVNLTDVNMVDLLYSYINREMWWENSVLFNLVGKDEFSNDSIFDKDSTIKHVSDMFGKPVNENMIADYSGIVIKDNTITVVPADGEGVAEAKVESYTIEGSRLRVSLRYEIEYNVEELNTAGKMTAVYVVNPNSFFGYSLESMKLE